MRKKISIALLVLALGVFTYAYRVAIRDWVQGLTQEPLPEAVTYSDTLPNIPDGNVAATETAEPTNTAADVVIPAVINLDVPFTSQAPFANWDEVHEDTCEEAALLMVHRFYTNTPFADAQDAEDELLAMVDFQNEHYGDYKSTSGEETAQLIRDYYDYSRVDVVYDITIDDVRREVAQGRPVILLAAGRELGNPNFKTPGPLYHALVVKGWTETEIITNDPGTRKGADYRYAPDVLMNAVHDWNNGDVTNGRSVMIVMYPNG